MKKEVENLLNEILSYLNCTEISSSDYETIENKINIIKDILLKENRTIEKDKEIIDEDMKIWRETKKYR